ncbi:MAG: GNAT family N-acetyltransferase [Hyphomicrobiales bacterium]|nr:GNAT family N-acetyltransferase [Hyphomicrobiales bacterium]
MAVELRVDPLPPEAELRSLLRDSWGEEPRVDFNAVLARSLVHVGACDGKRLVGFVNVAWDGGAHASIFDTSVHPDYRRRGIATSLIGCATEIARDRGAHWLHVDYEPHLNGFYEACGFRPTTAGLIRLR